MYTRGWAISATPNRLHWPKLQNIEKISIFHSSYNITVTQCDQMTKTRQKIVKLTDPPNVWRIFWIWSAWNDRKRKLCVFTEKPAKNSWNWLILLMSCNSLTNFLDMKCMMQWPETEVMWIYWNFVLKNSWNHFSRRNYFWWVPFWNFVQHSWQLLYWSQYRKIYYGFCRKLICSLICSSTYLKKNIF